MVDTSSSAITVIIKGKEITEKIIDGSSGVNVISQRTCDNLGDQRLGTMSILAKNGRYQFGPPNRTQTGLEHHYQRAHILNMCSSIATQ